MINVIEIARDFSDVPAGRYEDDGPFSGARFRDEILAPALSHSTTVHVVLDDVEGYGSSFLEEAFGGLIRNCEFKKIDLDKKLVVVAKSPEYESYRDMIARYIDDAVRVAKQEVA